MAQLHELIAIEPDRNAAATKIREECIMTFTKRQNHFVAKTKTLKMFDDTQAGTEAAGSETQEMVDTVIGKLDHVATFVSDYLDIFASKEATNQTAIGDIVLRDGSVLATLIPVTVLLGLENKLKDIRAVYEHIPTLAPGPLWHPDPTRSPGVYRSTHDEVRLKTEKQVKFQIMTPATDKHPAQIEKWNADVPVGTFTETIWSSMMSPADKSTLLGRIDDLIQAVKKGRQRANTAPAIELSIGTKLLGFINYGVVK